MCIVLRPDSVTAYLQGHGEKDLYMQMRDRKLDTLTARYKFYRHVHFFGKFGGGIVPVPIIVIIGSIFIGTFLEAKMKCSLWLKNA